MLGLVDKYLMSKKITRYQCQCTARASLTNKSHSNHSLVLPTILSVEIASETPTWHLQPLQTGARRLCQWQWRHCARRVAWATMTYLSVKPNDILDKKNCKSTKTKGAVPSCRALAPNPDLINNNVMGLGQDDKFDSIGSWIVITLNLIVLYSIVEGVFPGCGSTSWWV